MKIIFSRKGFDSATGGIPSPIFPDGTFCSLPIPSNQKPSLENIRFGKLNLGQIVEQLTGHSRVGKTRVHLDPDLNKNAVPRKKGWRPCFGQVGSSQTHLDNNQVGEGDLFLFFGWFREVILNNGRLRYQNGSDDKHCLFGWLQVGKVYKLGMDEKKLPKWIADHPHVKDKRKYPTNNTLYIAAERLQIPGLKVKCAGGGVFKKFTQCLSLTKSGQKRSIWRLPSEFYPKKGIPPLSYHSDMKRWHKDKKGVLLNSVQRGQEFVLDTDFYPGIVTWLQEIFKSTQ